jgi:hypothetical protein
MIADLMAQLRRPSPTSPAPQPFQVQRDDLAVFAVVIFALLLGLGIRSQALNASRSFALGNTLPTLRYPAGWITAEPEGLRFQAINPASPSTFDAQLAIAVRDLRADETLDLARAAWGLRRSEEMTNYRELTAEPVTVDGQPGLLTTYAYVADPARSRGAVGLPVVVQGQDLLFFDDGKLVAVTVAADATEWAAEQDHFALVFDSLQVQPIETDVLATPTLAIEEATPAATPEEGSEE